MGSCLRWRRSMGLITHVDRSSLAQADPAGLPVVLAPWCVKRRLSAVAEFIVTRRARAVIAAERSRCRLSSRNHRERMLPGDSR